MASGLSLESTKEVKLIKKEKFPSASPIRKNLNDISSDLIKKNLELAYINDFKKKGYSGSIQNPLCAGTKNYYDQSPSHSVTISQEIAREEMRRRTIESKVVRENLDESMRIQELRNRDKEAEKLKFRLEGVLLDKLEKRLVQDEKQTQKELIKEFKDAQYKQMKLNEEKKHMDASDRKSPERLYLSTLEAREKERQRELYRIRNFHQNWQVLETYQDLYEKNKEERMKFEKRYIEDTARHRKIAEDEAYKKKDLEKKLIEQQYSRENLQLMKTRDNSESSRIIENRNTSPRSPKNLTKDILDEYIQKNKLFMAPRSKYNIKEIKVIENTSPVPIEVPIKYASHEKKIMASYLIKSAARKETELSPRLNNDIESARKFVTEPGYHEESQLSINQFASPTKNGAQILRNLHSKTPGYGKYATPSPMKKLNSIAKRSLNQSLDYGPRQRKILLDLSFKQDQLIKIENNQGNRPHISKSPMRKKK